MPSSRCCGTSVGVIVTDTDGRMLMIERGWYPVGIAPVAGHVADAHTDPAEALVAEVAEETGLEVTSHQMLADGVWLPNLCASPPAAIPGHRWSVATATTTGTLAPDPEETRGAAWYRPSLVQALAVRTLAYARGEIDDDEFEREPGLEPVWVELLHITRHLPMALLPTDLDLVRRLYTTPPKNYWLDGRLVPAEMVARDQVPTAR